MRSTTKRILITAQAIVCLVATLGLGSCGRSSMTQSLVAPTHDGAAPLAKGQGNGGNVPPPPPPPVVVPPAPGVALKSITLTPTTVGGGTSAQGQLRIASNAPAGGVTVGLFSNENGTAQVPASVTIPAGTTRASFTVTTVPVATDHAVSIIATVNGVSLSSTLTVQAPQLASVALAPASLLAGGSSQGTVTLSSPAVGPAIIALSSSVATAAAMPASVTIPAGGTSATFAITTTPSLVASSTVVTGSLNGISRTATLTVAASDPCQSVTNLGGAVVLSDQRVPQFRTGKLRIDLMGDVAAGFINAMGTCGTAAAPTISFISGSANITMGAGSATATGAPLAFGPLTVPVPVEAGTVLATDAAGNVLQIVWPLLATGVAGPPVLRINMAAWNPAVHAGSILDAQFSFSMQGADGSTATFTAHGTGLVVPTFIP